MAIARPNYPMPGEQPPPQQPALPTQPAGQTNAEWLQTLPDDVLAQYLALPSSQIAGDFWLSVNDETKRRKATAASTNGAPAGLDADHQWVWNNFHDPRNKNPIRDPNDTDYAYWIGKKKADPNYNWDQRMFDKEGEGSNAGHFTTPPPTTTTKTGGTSPTGLQTLFDLAMAPGVGPSRDAPLDLASAGATDLGGRGLRFSQAPVIKRTPSGNALSLMDLANLIKQY